MRVYLNVQVFSSRVAHAITEQGKPGIQETVKFVKHMNDFFDCLNSNRINTQFECKSVYPIRWEVTDDFFLIFSGLETLGHGAGRCPIS